jgi:hypothetical protein
VIIRLVIIGVVSIIEASVISSIIAPWAIPIVIPGVIKTGI